jgi:hypothetical protein
LFLDFHQINSINSWILSWFIDTPSHFVANPTIFSTGLGWLACTHRSVMCLALSQYCNLWQHGLDHYISSTERSSEKEPLDSNWKPHAAVAA